MAGEPGFLADRWRAGERRSGRLVAVLAGACLSYLLLYAFVTLHRGERYPFGDFFALWSYAKIAIAHAPAELYDPGALHAAQVALGMESGQQNPFPYPPSFLLILWPLGFLTYMPAYALWIAASFGLYIWATVERSARGVTTAIAILAPTSTIMLVAGQSGFLAGALAIGGLRLIRTRPILAGVLLGLLSYKPQLWLLVPVALIAARAWRSIAAIGLTIAALVALTSMAFGWSIWPAWLASLPAYSRDFDASAIRYHLMPTVTANLQMLGLSLVAARLVQLAVAAGVAILIWRIFRPGATRKAGSALLAGTFLATPHAFVYDLPMLTGAIAGFVAEKLRVDGGCDPPEIAVLVFALAFPALMMFAGPHIPVSTLPELLLFGLVLARPRARPEGSTRRGATDPQLSET
ncbi:MAG: glycosyltransferase family 87 protein [Stellaceae bacterium]